MDICSFLGDQKESDKSATVEAGTFYGILPWGLTSFVTERSKQERCHRFDAVDADQGKPLDPAQRETIKCNFYRLLPGPPCGPGVYALPQREKRLDRANTCKEKVQLYRCHQKRFTRPAR